MTCFVPLEGYRQSDGSISTVRDGKSTGQFLTVSCGRCIGCRLRRAREWAVRCMHEDSQHDQSSFLTLTYRDADLPVTGSLVPHHHTDFMKRLRQFVIRKHGRKVRFYMCGEYGEGYSRPHYHYLVFGHGFHEDRYKWKKHNGHQYYRSESLEMLWPYGYALIGNVTPESAGYTARYILKKQLGESSELNPPTSAVPGCEGVLIEPEFTRMSLRPGIGADWAEKYGRSDIYDSGDFVVLNGTKYETPRYYDKIFGDLDERMMKEIKESRTKKAQGRAQETERKRLDQRHRHALERVKRLKRGYESHET